MNGIVNVSIELSIMVEFRWGRRTVNIQSAYATPYAIEHCVVMIRFNALTTLQRTALLDWPKGQCKDAFGD